MGTHTATGVRRLVFASGLSIVATFCATSVHADWWFDNFDSYAQGSINGQGGWRGWDGVPERAGTVSSTYSLSGPHAQQVDGQADSVHEFSGATSGTWTFRTDMYIPDDFVGRTFFIMLNKYTEVTGPWDWSVSLFFDPGLSGGVVYDGMYWETMPLIMGQWVPLAVVIDLTHDSRSIYYGGRLLSTHRWTTQQKLWPPTIAAVDLYANYLDTPAPPVYYDNMSLTPEPSATAALLSGLGGLLIARRRRG